MPQANRVITNTVGGEVSPLMHGRIDLPIYQRACAKCQNFIPRPEGGASYRTGTYFVNYTRLNKKAVFIPFQFSDQQSYLIEATDGKFRFYKDNGLILEGNKSITAMTNEEEAVITIANHGFENGDQIFISGLTGTTGLNNRYYLVTDKTTNTFKITTVFFQFVDTTNSGAYSGSGATAARVYEITAPYEEQHLPYLAFAQSADTMYIVHQEYEPRKLIRFGHADWEIGTYARSADFISDKEDFPRAVTFNESGRLLFGGSKRNPQTVWASAAPSSGNTDFDNFNDGINATDAVIFTFAAIHGKVDSIQWLSNTSKFVTAGTFSGIRRVYGGTEQEPLSPTSITAKSVNTFGCAYALPVSDGANLFYIQRGNKAVRSLEYDIQVDGYITVDRNLVSKHLTKPGIKQMVQQQSDPDVVWVVRDDGKLLGLTFKEREDISGWHRHYLSGQYRNANGLLVGAARVLWAGVMPRPYDGDQLWLINERIIDGATVRSVEYFSDPIDYPSREDYYADITETDEAEDNERFRNAMWEFNKTALHLDMALQYDGSELGTDSLGSPVAITNITKSATTEPSDAGVVTAPGHLFEDGDVIYISGVGGMTQVNNLFFEVYQADQISGTFKLIGQGDDVVLAEKPRGKKKGKKRLEGTQVSLVGPVNTNGFTAYTAGGTAAKLGVSLTLFAVSGQTNIVADGPVFTESMIGRQIWKSYDVNGDGGGRAEITGFVDSHEVECLVINDDGFDNLNTIPPGGWLLTTDQITGLEHLNNESVAVVADGANHIMLDVVDAAITLERQASIVSVGLGPYLGIIKTLNLDAGGVTGSAQAKMRNLWQAAIRLLNSVGTMFGTSPYRLEEISFDMPTYDRAVDLFTGSKRTSYIDKWQESEKTISVVQNVPLPCTVIAIDAFLDVADD